MGRGAGRGAAGARERPAGSTAVRDPEPGPGGLWSARRRAVLLEEGGAGAAMFVARSIAADHKDLIHDVSFDFHGRRMATCSSDQSVKVRAGPSPEGGGSVRGPLFERRGAWRVDSSRLEARCGHEVRSPGRLAGALLLVIAESTPPGPPPRGCGGVRASRGRACVMGACALLPRGRPNARGRSTRQGRPAGPQAPWRCSSLVRLGPGSRGRRHSGWGEPAPAHRGPSIRSGAPGPLPAVRPLLTEVPGRGEPHGRSAAYATSSRAGRNPLPGLQVLRGPGFLTHPSARPAVGVSQ